MGRLLASFFLTLVILLNAGCASTRLIGEYSCDSVQRSTATRVNLLWGIVQPKDIPAQCESKSICQVTTQSNLGFILLSTVTLGIVVPQKVVWCCCPSVEKIEKLD
ncbi:hypothetical protein AHMF7605_03345 [Adhaeribacter arboris]|uniref:Uncharacterized protein n=1 Tax=Adhaeribacter arboris TaxID=2072846 RepID=A0A2T2YAW7_9BACT|nr:hypothetical protein [Adhaeribacter arboris]PSR52626.1 hypothetical protein AHMF7605_03345 [Adhaeribacter arboris]